MVGRTEPGGKDCRVDVGCGSKLRDAEQKRSQRARRFAMTASAKVITTLCRLCHRPAAAWTGLTAMAEMRIPIPWKVTSVLACDGPMEEGCQKALASLQSHRWRAPLFRGRGCCQRLAGTTAPAPAVGAVSSVISSATGGSATVARPFPRLRTLWLGPLGARGLGHWARPLWLGHFLGSGLCVGHALRRSRERAPRPTGERQLERQTL